MDSPDKIGDLSINCSNEDLNNELTTSFHEQILPSAATEDNSSLEIGIKNSNIADPLTDISKADTISSNLSKSQVLVENINALSKEISSDSDSEKLDSDINFSSHGTLGENLIHSSDTLSCSPHENQQKSLSFSVSKFYNNYDIKSLELSSTSSDSSLDLDLENSSISKNDLDKLPKNSVEESNKEKYPSSFEENELLEKEDIASSSKSDICLLNDNANLLSNTVSPTGKMMLPDKGSDESNCRDELNNLVSKSEDSGCLNVTEQSDLLSPAQNKIQEIPLPVSILNLEKISKETSVKNNLETNSCISEFVQNAFIEGESDIQEIIPSTISLELTSNKSESCIAENKVSSSVIENPRKEQKEFDSILPENSIVFPRCHSIKSLDDSTLDVNKDSIHSFIEDDNNIYAVAENISITAENNADSLPYDSDQDMESDVSLKFHDDSPSQSGDETLLDNTEDCHTEKVGKNSELILEPVETKGKNVSSDIKQQEKNCSNLPKSKEVEENVHSNVPQNMEIVEEFDVKESFTSKSENNIKMNDFHSDQVKTGTKFESQSSNSKSCVEELERNVPEKNKDSECMIENHSNMFSLSVEGVVPNVIDKESIDDSKEVISHTKPYQNLVAENNTEKPCDINVEPTINQRLKNELMVTKINVSLCKDYDVNISKENENIDCLQESLASTNLSKSTHIEETESNTSTDASESSNCTVEKSENILEQKSLSAENLDISNSSHDSLQILPSHTKDTSCYETVCSPVKSPSTFLFDFSKKSDLINESQDMEMEYSSDNQNNETFSTTPSAMCQIVEDLPSVEPKTLNSVEKSSETFCADENTLYTEETNSQKDECVKTDRLDEKHNSKSEESVGSKSPFYISEEKKLENKNLCESFIAPDSNQASINSLKVIKMVNNERKGSEEQVEQPKVCFMEEKKYVKNNDSKENGSALLQQSSVKAVVEEEQLPEIKDSTVDFETSCCNPSCTVNENTEHLKDVNEDLTEKQSLLLEVETYFRKKEDLKVSRHVDMQQEFLSKGNFDWDDFLEKTISETTPPTAFLHVERSIETGVCVNQVLEVLLADDKASTDHSSTWLSYWPAKVVSSCGSLLRLKYLVSAQLKSSNAISDFWCELSNPKIRPLGWSKEKNIPIQPPPEFQSENDFILDEGTLTTLDPVPEEAFDCEKRELFNRISEGTLLEVLDSQYPYDGMIVKVLKNVGGRLLLSFTEEAASHDLDKTTFWLFFLDKRIRPLGWIYKRGEPYRYKNSNFKELLKDFDKTNDRGTTFLSSLNTSFCNHNLEEGMHLEAFNPVNSQSIHAAVVSRVLSDSYFELKIDDYSWVTTIEDPLIVPCGFAEENCLDLIPPNNYSQEEFSWRSYVTLKDSRMSPCEAFPKHTLSSELGFDVGQKLEVASPVDPDQICIATIERVLQHILLLKSDSNPNFLFYRSAASMDIFPAGWAHSNSYPLAVPYWYVERSRNPSVSQNEENDILPDSIVNIEKSPWTNYNSLWCPRLFINHCCNPGTYLSKTKVSKMAQSVGPGPLPLVLRDVISMTINAAYIPTRVLRELQNLKKMHSSWQSIPLKAKILMSCPNLWSFDNIGENCPLVCNKQVLPKDKAPITLVLPKEKPPITLVLSKEKAHITMNMLMISSGTAMYRGRGGIRGSVFRRKKGGKKRLFYPIKPSANNNEDNTEEFCYPEEGEEVEEVISESEGESRPSSPSSSDVQRKLKPKRILSSLEITMNDSRSCDIIKERSTKRSRGEIETDFSSRQQTTTGVRTEDTSGDRKKARIEEKSEIEVEAETEAEAVIYGLETAQVDSDPLGWSIDDVERYVSSQPDISHHAVKLKEQEVDGRALLLLNLPSLIHHMGLPHSVAVILAQHICKVKMAHFVNYYPKYVKKIT
ncbi:Scm-like with four MBT domains protein 2 [Armadillidium nasatum]|uniref:Scm-like with four MBT domains protein 2 n=1 Tax=Armadillidium nasatum TaxID=96803 RepID=A0A5N5SRC3_9CRUS|nr:Scm-like with four MBT domains protein 2 [Armadillidium nasatum]